MRVAWCGSDQGQLNWYKAPGEDGATYDFFTAHPPVIKFHDPFVRPAIVLNQQGICTFAIKLYQEPADTPQPMLRAFMRMAEYFGVDYDTVLSVFNTGYCLVIVSDCKRFSVEECKSRPEVIMSRLENLLNRI